MAKEMNVGYTNKTASTKTLTLTKLGLQKNYGLIEDEKGSVTLTNLTSSVSQPERVHLRAMNLKDVFLTVPNNYPPSAKGGIQYSVKVETLISETSSTDEAYRVDHPISVVLTIKHDTSGAVTPDAVEGAIVRALSCLYTDAGDSRIPSLMHMAVKPEQD